MAAVAITPEVVRRIETAEHEAWREIDRAAPPEIRAALGIACISIGDGAAFAASKIDHIQFNRLAGLGVTREIAAEELDEGIAIFERLGLANWIVHVPPQSHNLAALCAARGFVPHSRSWAKFARDAGPPAMIDTDLQIREIDAEYGDAFGATASSGFGMPPIVGKWLAAIPGRPNWHCFLAFDGDTPAAAGALYICERTGWLGIGATLENYRGRKAQQAILAARIAKGIERGCELFTTETGIPHAGEAGPSFKNIQRAGLQIAYERQNLKRP